MENRFSNIQNQLQSFENYFSNMKIMSFKATFFSKIRIFIFQTLLISRKESEFSSIRNYFLTLFDPKYVQNYSGFLLAKIPKDNLTHLEEMK